jgi:hypothetical protein
MKVKFIVLDPNPEVYLESALLDRTTKVLRFHAEITNFASHFDKYSCWKDSDYSDVGPGRSWGLVDIGSEAHRYALAWFNFRIPMAETSTYRCLQISRISRTISQLIPLR